MAKDYPKFLNNVASTADLVFEQCVKLWDLELEHYVKTIDLELELLVKPCENSLLHVQLWDFAQYSNHWDIKNVDLQFVILENFVLTWGKRFEWMSIMKMLHLNHLIDFEANNESHDLE